MPPVERKRIRARVHGLVQGVNFRRHTAEAARELGVAGWVRNLEDGRVELEAEGSPSAIDELLVRVRKGPAFSRVEGVDSVPLEPTGEDGAFRILR